MDLNNFLTMAEKEIQSVPTKWPSPVTKYLHKGYCNLINKKLQLDGKFHTISGN